MAAADPRPQDVMTPDARTGWVDHLPPGFRPFLRLMRADRLIGVWLLFLPCVWGVLIGRPDATPAPDIYRLLGLFAVGAFVMRSAGCIYNDIVDRDIDAQVTRTADRPLAAGTVTLPQAWALLVVLCLVGLAVLVQLGALAIMIGLGALGLVGAYPFMKRITWWPQAWLGLTFNWGVLVGAAAVSGSVTPAALVVYAAGVFWTLAYDTIYAHQDREDDAMVGVKSSARRLGDASGTAVGLFFGLTIVGMAVALMLEGVSFWLILLAPAAAHFVWQVAQLDIDDPDQCLALFKSNLWAGGLLALPLLAA